MNHGGAQINQVGGHGNSASISQSSMPPEYAQLVETLRVQIATLLQLDEFVEERASLVQVQEALEAESTDQEPTPRLKRSAQLLSDVLSRAATSALAGVILKNASRLLALLP